MVFRYDYEGCETAPCEKIMTNLNDLVDDPAFIGKSYSYQDKTFKVAKADNFGYTDPIDSSISTKQVNLL